MSYLLDTHAFLWWASGDLRLPDSVRHILAVPELESLISIVTPWEVAINVSIGKLSDQGSFGSLMQRSGFALLSISLEHIEIDKHLPLHHRDPFDRMLIAQALSEDMTLISNETIFDAYGVRRIWDQ